MDIIYLINNKERKKKLILRIRFYEAVKKNPKTGSETNLQMQGN